MEAYECSGEYDGEDDEAAHGRRGAAVAFATIGVIDPADSLRQNNIERGGQGRGDGCGNEKHTVGFELKEVDQPVGYAWLVGNSGGQSGGLS